jgi:predicted permease
MISHGYWSRRFGLAQSAIGRTVLIGGEPFTIIGVTPAGFFGVEVGAAPDIFVPLMMEPTVIPSFGDFTARGRRWCIPLARLRAGAGVRRATAELEALYRQATPALRPRNLSQFSDQARKWLAANSVEWHVAIVPAGAGLSELRLQFSQVLFLLMAAVGVVLLIACANTASLLLARAAVRRPEFTMRLALGASRGRLVRQLLVESLLLAAMGGALGILLAVWATRLLVVYLSAGRNPVTLNLTPDVRVVAFTAAVSILTGLLFGLAPALQGTATLRPARTRFRPGRMLAVAQVALSLLLLIAAGLFTRSLQNLNGRGQGLRREQVLTIRVEPRGSETREVRKTLDAKYRDLIRRVEAIPGVQSASMAEVTPTSPGGGNFGAVQTTAGKYSEPISVIETYPNYFASAGIPLAAGRDLTPRDLNEDAPTACVVNQALVRTFYPNTNPIGLPCEGGQIVGVVQDSRAMNPTGAIQPLIYTAYLHSHTGRGAMVLYVRSAAGASWILPRIREAVRGVDQTVPQFQVRTLAQEMDAALVRERLVATLSSLFGAAALLLACVGLYGLLAFAVVQRTGEMGIRMALGAARGDVLWMVLREALALALAGIAIGLPAALALGRLAASRIPGLLFQLETTDPPTIALAALLLVLVAVLASYLPARRASRIDPMSALRNE